MRNSRRLVVLFIRKGKFVAKSDCAIHKLFASWIQRAIANFDSDEGSVCHDDLFMLTVLLYRPSQLVFNRTILHSVKIGSFKEPFGFKPIFDSVEGQVVDLIPRKDCPFHVVFLCFADHFDLGVALALGCLPFGVRYLCVGSLTFSCLWCCCKKNPSVLKDSV